MVNGVIWPVPNSIMIRGLGLPATEDTTTCVVIGIELLPVL